MPGEKDHRHKHTHLFGLLRVLVDTDDHRVVTLKGLKRELLLWLNPLLTHLLDLAGKDDLGSSSAVDTVGLDRHHDTTAVLEEVVGVDTDNPGLVRLGNVGEDTVDHVDEHPVFQRVTGILDDGNDVGPVSGHVQKITAGPVGEFDGKDHAGGTDQVGNVRD